MKMLRCLSLAVLGTSLLLSAAMLSVAAGNSRQSTDSIQVFWDKFRAAVIKGDKITVASHTRFPVAMPYGMGEIKNKAQLSRRYRSVFNGEADAAKCFGTARPETDPARRNEFTVACKNAAGDEVVIYTFARTATGWKFVGLDNLNE